MLNDVSRWVLRVKKGIPPLPRAKVGYVTAFSWRARSGFHHQPGLPGPPQATRWIRRRGSGVDNTAGVKRQEAPETLLITQVSQQCAALSP